MTKKEFAKYVAEKSGYTQNSASEMVNIVFEQLIQAVVEYGVVDITGVGRFKKSHRDSRHSVDIRDVTKRREIPEYDTMTFKPSRVIKARFASGDSKQLR